MYPFFFLVSTAENFPVNKSVVLNTPIMSTGPTRMQENDHTISVTKWEVVELPTSEPTQPQLSQFLSPILSGKAPRD